MSQHLEMKHLEMNAAINGGHSITFVVVVVVVVVVALIVLMLLQQHISS